MQRAPTTSYNYLYIIPFIVIIMENGICPRSGTFPFAWIISFLLMFIGFYPRVGNPNTYWTIIWIIWSNQAIGGGIDIPLPFFWIVTLNLGLRTADPSSSAEYPSNTPNTWHANGTKGGPPPLGKATSSFLKPKFFKRTARLGLKTLQNMLKWLPFANWNNLFFFDGRQSQQRLQQLPPELHV